MALQSVRTAVMNRQTVRVSCCVRPHRPHAVCWCGLLLQMSHV